MFDNRQNHNRNQEDTVVNEQKKIIKKYVKLKDLPAEDLVSIADKMGSYLKNKGLKTSQIRKFLDGVRKIDSHFDRGKSFNRESVILLKPKLAYAAGRQASVKTLMEILDPAIDAGSDSYESFKKLVALIEGIVAYHKYYGGGD